MIAPPFPTPRHHTAAPRHGGAQAERQPSGGRPSRHTTGAASTLSAGAPALVAVLVNGRIEAVGPADQALLAVIDALEARPETERLRLGIEWAPVQPPGMTALPPQYWSLWRPQRRTESATLTVRWRGNTLYVPQADVVARTTWRVWAWVGDDGSTALVYAHDAAEATRLLREAGVGWGNLHEARLPGLVAKRNPRYRGAGLRRRRGSLVPGPAGPLARALRNPSVPLRGAAPVGRVVPARVVMRRGGLEVDAGTDALQAGAVLVGEDGNVVAVEE